MVFFHLPFLKSMQFVDFGDYGVATEEIRRHISLHLGLPDFKLYYNGRQLVEGQEVSRNGNVYVTLSLPGGKGGFGSMLRAIGAQIEKTTNREACRDLSGRRLRDINEEQRLKKWIAKESERKAEKIQRRKEKIERLKSKPKHYFVDAEYEKERADLPDRIDDALTAGIQKASKRPSLNEASTSAGCSKKKRLWMDEDISTSSGSESESQDTNLKDGPESTSVVQKHEDSMQIQESEASESEASSSVSFPDTLKEPVSEEQRSSNTIDEISSSSCNSDLNEKMDLGDKADSSLPCSKSSKEASSCEMPSTSSELSEDLTPIDISTFESVSELESLGQNRLKSALMARGLKCGGNLADRAQRLWEVRNLSPSDYPTKLLAKNKN